MWLTRRNEYLLVAPRADDQRFSWTTFVPIGKVTNEPMSNDPLGCAAVSASGRARPDPCRHRSLAPCSAPPSTVQSTFRAIVAKTHRACSWWSWLVILMGYCGQALGDTRFVTGYSVLELDHRRSPRRPRERLSAGGPGETRTRVADPDESWASSDCGTHVPARSLGRACHPMAIRHDSATPTRRILREAR